MFSPLSLTSLPTEILLILGFEHLDHKAVVSLTQTCQLLRSSLSSQALWAHLVFQKTGISYIHQGGNWREAYFDGTFCDLCPHLSPLTMEDTMEERARRFSELLDSKPMNQIECSAEDCHVTNPDLWLCLTKDCGIVGCSRITNRHGVSHFRNSKHSLCLKLDSLEFWCYDCVKWVGNPSSLAAEREAIHKITSKFLADKPFEPYISLAKAAKWNDRRNVEREIMRLEPADKLYFVSTRFIEDWRNFLRSTSGPPSAIDNSTMLLKSGRINPYLVPMRDFQVVSEKSWNLLKGCYGGGPAVCEDDIPDNDPLYEELNIKTQNCRHYVIAHNRHDDFSVKSGTRREKELVVSFPNIVAASSDFEESEESEEEFEQGDFDVSTEQFSD